MSKIEWCDETWQVVSGCTPVTEGCRNCYSARLCGTRLKHNPRTAGLTRRAIDGRHVFTGEVRCHDDQLGKPLHWQKPRRIFVADRGDLFHADVPEGFIDKVFAVMALCPQHAFMVLTKRPERMYDYFREPRRLGNVWLGTSISDQADAGAMVPWLLRCHAWRHFVSCEPALGPVDFTGIDVLSGIRKGDQINALSGFDSTGGSQPRYPRLDQVIFGGESGDGKRPVDLAWARQARDQCKAAGVAFFMKQVDKVQPIPADLNIREWPS